MSEKDLEPNEAEIESESGGSTSSKPSFSQSYMFGVELSIEEPIYHWQDPSSNSEYSSDDGNAVQEVLTLTGVCLGVGAVPSERNVVHLKSVTELGEEVQHAIASLTCGVCEMQSISFKFKDLVDVTLELVEGTGPVSVVGNLFTTFNYKIETSQLADSNEYDETDSDGVGKGQESSDSEVEPKDMRTMIERLEAAQMAAQRRSRQRTLTEGPTKEKAAGVSNYNFMDGGYAVRSKQHGDDVRKVKKILAKTEQSPLQHCETLQIKTSNVCFSKQQDSRTSEKEKSGNMKKTKKSVTQKHIR